MGYKKFYFELIKLLINSEAITNTVIATGIRRIDKIKDNNRKRKRTKKNMRDRTHGKESKTKKEIYEARIDAKKNLGTYKSSIAMNDESDEDDDKQMSNEQRDHTQQLSDVSINKQQSKNKKQKTKQYCPWCKAETNHKTWRSVSCSAHDEYLQQRTCRKTKEKKDTINITYEDDGGKKRKKLVKLVSVLVVVMWQSVVPFRTIPIVKKKYRDERYRTTLENVGE